MIPVHGNTSPGFERVRDAFQASFDGNPAMGAALSIRVHGKDVVDLWGGYADARAQTPWLADTATVIFSCTKGLVSLLAARLVQEGRLDYDAPVADYWPEFAVAGKEEVLVRHLLSHQAGLSAPREDLTVAGIIDWDFVVDRLARQEPLWRPGEGHAYHAITHGWLVGEVISRITGQSVGSYLSQLTESLGADAWIGLPANFAQRVAHVHVGESHARLTQRQLAEQNTDGVDWSIQAMTLGQALPFSLVQDDAGFNDPRIQAAEIPAAGGIATARGLAALWSASIVDEGPGPFLQEETISRATAVQSEGQPVFGGEGPWPRWGMGFQIDSPARHYLTSRSFGHDGAGGQVAFADPESGVGFAFLTNQLEGAEDTRATSIIGALRDSLKL